MNMNQHANHGNAIKQFTFTVSFLDGLGGFGRAETEGERGDLQIFGACTACWLKQERSS